MRKTAINTEATDQIGQTRFRELLCGHNRDRAPYDRPLLEIHECVVAPTLGSIIPNWLLVVPRRAAISFREWQATTRVNPVRLVGEILAELRINAEQAIWFEHGPSAEGTGLGCGVDYAHLHVLFSTPLSLPQFAAVAAASARVDWRRIPAREAYASISAERSSYLVAGSLSEAVLSEDVEAVGSQFFRRVVARLANKPDQWNYKTHAHLENVQRTVSAFNSRRALAPVL